MEALIQDVNRDEVRDGFLVILDRKKVWNVELILAREFDRICKKHRLNYFLSGGTLLGAVKYGGFIPWDDAFRLMMPRPDFNRLREIIFGELPPWYFFQDAVSDAHYTSAMAKLRDSRTTAIEDPARKDANQGIFLAIYPLDGDSGVSEEERQLFEGQKELWQAVVDPEGLLARADGGVLSPEERLALARMPKRERLDQYESFAGQRFEIARYVSIPEEAEGKSVRLERSWFAEAVSLPFETTRFPAPAGYEAVLSRLYGDYRTYRRSVDNLHPLPRKKLYSADIPYEECLRKIDF